MKKLIIIICFFAVLLGIGFTALYLFYDGTKINEIQLSDFGSGSGIVNQASLYEAAHKEPGRFSYGGVKNFRAAEIQIIFLFKSMPKLKLSASVIIVSRYLISVPMLHDGCMLTIFTETIRRVQLPCIGKDFLMKQSLKL